MMLYEKKFGKRTSATPSLFTVNSEAEVTAKTEKTEPFFLQTSFWALTSGVKTHKFNGTFKRTKYTG